MMTDARSALRTLIENSPDSYASISALIGRNPAYIQQYIERGSPRELKERDRRTIARHFAVKEALLGGSVSHTDSELFRIPVIDGGGGSPIAFSRAWIDSQGWDAEQLRAFEMPDDSMVPRLARGDMLIVEQSSCYKGKGTYLVNIQSELKVCNLSSSISDKRIKIQRKCASDDGVLRHGSCQIIAIARTLLRLF